MESGLAQINRRARCGEEITFLLSTHAAKICRIAGYGIGNFELLCNNIAHSAEVGQSFEPVSMRCHDRGSLDIEA
jgi:hypothetical protein